MSNYKWVRCTNGSVILTDENFCELTFPEVDDLDNLLKAKLRQHGLHSSEQTCRIFNPTDLLHMVDITAPLFKYEYNDQYVKILDSLTRSTTIPSYFFRLREELIKCENEVKEEQEKQFTKLFEENSLDGGISSRIIISSDSYKEPNYFYEKYIPKGYIKIYDKQFLFSYTRHDCVFIKHIDAKGRNVTITVPDFYKGLIIGKGGKNIKRIADMINAKRINVI